MHGPLNVKCVHIGTKPLHKNPEITKDINLHKNEILKKIFCCRL